MKTNLAMPKCACGTYLRDTYSQYRGVCVRCWTRRPPAPEQIWDNDPNAHP